MYLQYLQFTKFNGLIPNYYIVDSHDNETNPALFEESPGIWNSLDCVLPPQSYVADFYSWFVLTYVDEGYPYPSLSYNAEYFTHYSFQYDLMVEYFTDLGLEVYEDYHSMEYFAVFPGDNMYWSIINELRAGRPVLANTQSHSFIVYGYVPNTMKLIVHNGYHNNSSHDIFDWELTPQIQYATAYGFYAHQHSYHYINGDAGYCFCGDEVCNYPYQHKHQWVLQLAQPHNYFYCSICEKIVTPGVLP